MSTSSPTAAGKLVRRFHEHTGVMVRRVPASVIPEAERRLRVRLLIEEVVEAVCAMEGLPVPDGLVDQIVALLPRTDGEVTVDLVNLARELGDVLYVTHGAGLHYGIDTDHAAEAVHRSNMSKMPICDACLGEPSDGCQTCRDSGFAAPNRRPDGKILKPVTFTAPDMSRALAGLA